LVVPSQGFDFLSESLNLPLISCSGVRIVHVFFDNLALGAGLELSFEILVFPFDLFKLGLNVVKDIIEIISQVGELGDNLVGSGIVLPHDVLEEGEQGFNFIDDMILFSIPIHWVRTLVVVAD
jgi:hypothetical protein